jgi:hypothetical protein
MRRINTLSELRAEQKRLKSRRLFLEAEIKKEFRELKESLEPASLLKNTARRSLEGENSKFLGTSAGNIANFLAKLTLKRSGLISRLVIPFLVKNVTSNLIEKNKGQLVSWLGGVVSKFTEKKTLSRQTYADNKS